MISTRTAQLGILAATAVLAGCGPANTKVPTFPVTGRVLDGTKPVAFATVIFHPQAGSPDAPKPRGKTDAEGAFTLTTYDTNDGAPAGKYRVTIELWTTPSPDQGPVSKFPPKYANPDQSGLTAEVGKAAADLPPFVVKK